jgi:hypothetical protein
MLIEINFTVMPDSIRHPENLAILFLDFPQNAHGE